LLHLQDTNEYHNQILIRAARHAQENDCTAEAIKLYNLAEDYATVVACLAQALGNTVGLASPDEKAKGIERTAVEILRHYERGNRGGGKDRDAVVKLLSIREAMEAKKAGRPEVALEVRLFFKKFLLLFDLELFFLD
jgi:nuclear pore complex protein Nup93